MNMQDAPGKVSHDLMFRLERKKIMNKVFTIHPWSANRHECPHTGETQSSNYFFFFKEKSNEEIIRLII